MKSVPIPPWLIITLSASILPTIAHAAPLNNGSKAPTFTVKTLDGKQINFPGNYKGKLVLLDFWATWCGPCMENVPGLVNAYREFHPKGLEILGFSLDKPTDSATVRRVMAEKHITWDMCLSKAEFKGFIPQLYGVEYIPAMFLVDGDTGKIIVISGEGGPLTAKKLVPTLQAAIEAKANERPK